MHIYIEGNQAYVHTPYNPDFVALVKAIPGRRWHSDERAWSVPADRVEDVRQAMRQVWDADDTDTTEQMITHEWCWENDTVPGRMRYDDRTGRAFRAVDVHSKRDYNGEIGLLITWQDITNTEAGQAFIRRTLTEQKNKAARRAIHDALTRDRALVWRDKRQTLKVPEDAEVFEQSDGYYGTTYYARDGLVYRRSIVYDDDGVESGTWSLSAGQSAEVLEKIRAFQAEIEEVK